MHWHAYLFIVTTDTPTCTINIAVKLDFTVPTANTLSECWYETCSECEILSKVTIIWIFSPLWMLKYALTGPISGQVFQVSWIPLSKLKCSMQDYQWRTNCKGLKCQQQWYISHLLKVAYNKLCTWTASSCPAWTYQHFHIACGRVHCLAYSVMRLENLSSFNFCRLPTCCSS